MNCMQRCSRGIVVGTSRVPVWKSVTSMAIGYESDCVFTVQLCSLWVRFCGWDSSVVQWHSSGLMGGTWRFESCGRSSYSKRSDAPNVLGAPFCAGI